MKKPFSFSSILSIFLVAWIAVISSVSYAQNSLTEECSQAQADFGSAMAVFRSAFFEREEAEGSAESVMEGQVVPSAERLYQDCPAELNAAIAQGIERAKVSLNHPSRAQLVQCDKDLITYNGNLRSFDNRVLPSYQDYRNLLNSEVSPSATAAINSCIQMPDLAQQTRVEIAERQRRLDSMEDIDNSGPSYWDTRGNMDDYSEAYEAATE